MKTVFNGHEIAHIWAKQSQDNGRTSNNSIYFEGTQIYSYGRHFCMGKILPGNIVLLTDRTYSNTTHKHMNSVRYAVNHMQRIYIPFPEGNIRDNAKELINQIKSLLDVIGNPRRKQQTKDSAKSSLASIVANIEAYLKVTGQKLSTRWVDTDLQKEFNLYFKAAKDEQSIAILAEKLNKLAVAKKKEETKRQKENLQNWLNGGTNYVYGIEKVYLRKHERTYGTVVETSKGASVSYHAAKVLFDMIKAGRDIKGHNIDGYTVISLNGVLKIGCHEIERKEIERFAKLQNWV